MKKLVTLHMYMGTSAWNHGDNMVSDHDFRLTKQCMDDKVCSAHKKSNWTSTKSTPAKLKLTTLKRKCKKSERSLSRA